MKTEPTDIDREAASLFRLTPGMRAWWPVDVEIDDMFFGVPSLARLCNDRLIDPSSETPVAIDTDDPATVGCMLAQVEQAANHTLSEVADNGEDHRRPERRHAVMVWSARANCERHEAAHGPTRGAALVAAMRKLKNGENP